MSPAVTRGRSGARVAAVSSQEPASAVSLDAAFFSHWPYQVSNLVLAALAYTLAARLALALLLGAESPFVIARAVRAVSDPVLAMVGAITPRAVPRGWLPACAIVWLVGLRVVLFVGFAAAGLRPGLGG